MGCLEVLRGVYMWCMYMYNGCIEKHVRLYIDKGVYRCIQRCVQRVYTGCVIWFDMGCDMT